MTTKRLKDSNDAKTMLGSWALEFDPANVSHVNHGQFWVPGTAYTKFHAEVLIKPTAVGYFISAGYGGAHCLLWGVTGDSVNGWTLTGNVYDSDTSTATSFATTDVLRDNEWAHVAATYDNAIITLYINGVPSSIVARTLQRKTASATDGVLFVGGSDHINFGGRLAGIRLFETNVPFDNMHQVALRPAVSNFGSIGVLKGASTMINAVFLADYRQGSLADLSLGLSGVKHNGYLAEANTSVVDVKGSIDDPIGYNRNASKYPTWVIDPFAYSTTASAQKTQIASTRIYDDFSRTDVHYGNSSVLGAGTTRIGSKVWSSASYGIIGGSMYADSSGSGQNIITDTQTDGTIIWRRPVASMPAGIGATYRFIFRYAGASTHYFLYVDEFGSGYVMDAVDLSHGAGLTIGTSWTEVKVVLTGGSVEVFIDGVSKGTRTMTNYLTATSKGVEFSSPLLRLSEFGVI